MRFYWLLSNIVVMKSDREFVLVALIGTDAVCIRRVASHREIVVAVAVVNSYCMHWIMHQKSLDDDPIGVIKEYCTVLG